MHCVLSVLSLFATTAVLLAAEAGSVEAGAQELVSAPLVTQEGDVAGTQSHPFFGVQGDVGLPDGAGASLLIMPLSWLRLHLGGLATLSGSGMRAGVTLVATPRATVRPTLGVEAGYSFSGNASWLPFIGAMPLLSNALQQVSYAWGSAQAGFELGSPHFSVIIRGGLSYVDLTFAGPRLDVGGASLSASSMSLRGIVPSAKVGLMIAF